MTDTSGRTAKPPLLDSVIRFLVWSSIFGTMALPVVLIFMFNTQALLSLPFLRQSDKFGETVREVLVERPSQKSEIVARNGTDRKAAQIERLKSLTTRPEMASGAAAQLYFVGIAFDDAKPDPLTPYRVNSRHVVDDDGYRRLSLDLSRAPKDAVVVISDQPVRWNIVGMQPNSWGRIGFEGHAAFDVAEGTPGVLAGFRVAAFGAQNTARALEPMRMDSINKQAFCSAVRTWMSHFGVTIDQVQFTLLLNPTRVNPHDYSIGSDGEFRTVMGGRAIDNLCKR